MIWWFASIEKNIWSHMTPNVLTDTMCHYTAQNWAQTILWDLFWYFCLYYSLLHLHAFLIWLVLFVWLCQHKTDGMELRNNELYHLSSIQMKAWRNVWGWRVEMSYMSMKALYTPNSSILCVYLLICFVRISPHLPEQITVTQYFSYLNAENLTFTLEVNLFAFAYKLFHEDFSSIDGTNWKI